VDSDPVRVYPLGPFASHLLGYVREVDASELKRRNDEAYRADLPKTLGARIAAKELARLRHDEYRPRDIVGKMGVERFADIL
jgi:cell division protein FtsI/penicillin-binding protein 2